MADAVDDIAFGTADQFLRTDFNLSHLEVIRGGSASTLASNSPGGIINFISKTGAEPGGAVGLTFGLDGGRQTRVDADYGGSLGKGTTFHIGGFQRTGEGDRPTGFTAAQGGQVKASITHDFGSGYSSFRYLAELPVHFLKLEGWMVQSLVTQRRVRQLVETIVSTARTFGLKTVAECVENGDTAQVLCDIGVDWAQGHYFGRPRLASGQSVE